MGYRNYSRRVNNDPRVIEAKFASKCHETGKPIAKGEKCVYYPLSRAVFSMDSKQADEFKGNLFCEKCLGLEY